MDAESRERIPLAARVARLWVDVILTHALAAAPVQGVLRPWTASRCLIEPLAPEEIGAFEDLASLDNSQFHAVSSTLALSPPDQAATNVPAIRSVTDHQELESLGLRLHCPHDGGLGIIDVSRVHVPEALTTLVRACFARLRRRNNKGENQTSISLYCRREHGSDDGWEVVLRLGRRYAGPSVDTNALQVALRTHAFAGAAYRKVSPHVALGAAMELVSGLPLGVTVMTDHGARCRIAVGARDAHGVAGAVIPGHALADFQRGAITGRRLMIGDAESRAIADLTHEDQCQFDPRFDARNERDVAFLALRQDARIDNSFVLGGRLIRVSGVLPVSQVTRDEDLFVLLGSALDPVPVALLQTGGASVQALILSGKLVFSAFLDGLHPLRPRGVSGAGTKPDETRPLTQPGDSGAPVVLLTGSGSAALVGYVVAGATRNSTAPKLKRESFMVSAAEALACLGLTLAGPDEAADDGMAPATAPVDTTKISVNDTDSNNAMLDKVRVLYAGTPGSAGATGLGALAVASTGAGMPSDLENVRRAASLEVGRRGFQVLGSQVTIDERGAPRIVIDVVRPHWRDAADFFVLEDVPVQIRWPLRLDATDRPGAARRAMFGR